MKIQIIISICLLLFSQLALAAKTYITIEGVDVFSEPNGQQVEHWPSRIIFTSSSEDTEWVRVSGHFPEGLWQPLSPNLFLHNGEAIKERVSETKNAPKVVVYQTLKSRQSTARAYKLREGARVFDSRRQAEIHWQSLKDKEKAKALNSPLQSTGNELDFATRDQSDLQSKISVYEPQTQGMESTRHWSTGFTFTSNFQTQKVIKATGFFPEGKWQKLPTESWLVKPVRMQDRTRPSEFIRPEGAKRFAVIDKTKFEVVVYEVLNGEQSKLMKAPVALGYDRCLSADKGGKCYYTPEGQYEIEFKLFDADGINWCVPKKMEAEFKEKLARGERCWRGIMGRHALHFGNSLFLHGTSNPNSIGSRSTHGCVRLRNNDISLLYRLLQKGDSVLISEQPEEFDLIALAAKPEELQREKLELEAPKPMPAKTTKVTLIED